MGKDCSPERIQDFIRAYKTETLAALEQVGEESVGRVITMLAECRDAGQQIFICGNGGSATTASHFASELGKGSSAPNGKRFRVLALTDNVAWMTALANDLDYAQVFVEQLKNYAQSGDLLIALSSSGDSSNVIQAVSWANQRGLHTIGMTGVPGGQLARLARHPIQVASSHTGHIEDGHFLIQHLAGYYFMQGGGGD